MERHTNTIIGFLFCIIGIFIAPLLYENHPYGEIFFLIMLYFIPALILAILNGILLRLIEQKARNLSLKVGIGFIPLLILALLAIGKESPIQFISTFGIIGIGITNLIWTIKLINKKPVANNV